MRAQPMKPSSPMAAPAGPERVISTLRKNEVEELRLSRAQWRGVEMLSLRVWEKKQSGAGSFPRGGAGFNLRLDLLPKLIFMLERAEAEAVAQGLLPHDPR
jgi:hypothetical protein